MAGEQMILEAINPPASGRAEILGVRSKEGVVLGEIRWIPVWQNFAFFPSIDGYTAPRLRDLALLMEEQRDLMVAK